MTENSTIQTGELARKPQTENHKVVIEEDLREIDERREDILTLATRLSQSSLFMGEEQVPTGDAPHRSQVSTQRCFRTVSETSADLNDTYGLLDDLARLVGTGITIQYDPDTLVTFDEKNDQEGRQYTFSRTKILGGKWYKFQPLVSVSRSPQSIHLETSPYAGLDVILSRDLRMIEMEATTEMGRKEKLTAEAKKLAGIRLVGELARACLEGKKVSKSDLSAARSIMRPAVLAVALACIGGAGMIGGPLALEKIESVRDGYDKKEYERAKQELAKIAELKAIDQRVLFEKYEYQPEWQLALIELLPKIDQYNFEHFIHSPKAQLLAIPKLSFHFGYDPINSLIQEASSEKVLEALMIRFTQETDPENITVIFHHLNLSPPQQREMIEKATTLKPEILRYIKDPELQKLALAKMENFKPKPKSSGDLKTFVDSLVEYSGNDEVKEEVIKRFTQENDPEKITLMFKHLKLNVEEQKSIIEHMHLFEVEFFAYIKDSELQKLALTKIESLSPEKLTAVRVSDKHVFAFLLEHAINDDVKLKIIAIALKEKSLDIVTVAALFGNAPNTKDRLAIIEKLDICDDDVDLGQLYGLFKDNEGKLLSLSPELIAARDAKLKKCPFEIEVYKNGMSLHPRR